MSDRGDEQGEDEQDEPDEPDEPRRAPGPRAAYASNWITVLAVDASMGLAVAAAGLIAMVVWIFWLGALLALVGCFYLALVVRRGRYWHHLRRAAGL